MDQIWMKFMRLSVYPNFRRVNSCPWPVSVAPANDLIDARFIGGSRRF